MSSSVSEDPVLKRLEPRWLCFVPLVKMVQTSSPSWAAMLVSWVCAPIVWSSTIRCPVSLALVMSIIRPLDLSLLGCPSFLSFFELFENQ